jgi:anti-sigma factor RsiW
MTCRQVVDFLDRYCDGELPRVQRARFRLHLALCGNCRRYLATYRKTIRLSKAALGDLDQPPPAEVPEELVQAILAAQRK